MFPKIEVSPNHPILIGFSLINHPFGGTIIFGNTHMPQIGHQELDEKLVELSPTRFRARFGSAEQFFVVRTCWALVDVNVVSFFFSWKYHEKYSFFEWPETNRILTYLKCQKKTAPKRCWSGVFNGSIMSFTYNAIAFGGSVKKSMKKPFSQWSKMNATLVASKSGLVHQFENPLWLHSGKPT